MNVKSLIETYCSVFIDGFGKCIDFWMFYYTTTPFGLIWVILDTTYVVMEFISDKARRNDGSKFINNELFIYAVLKISNY